MKRTLALMLALLTVLGLLAGCAKEPEVTPDPTPTPGPSDPTPTPTPDPVKPAEPKILLDVRSAEDTTMNVFQSNLVADLTTMYLVVGRLYNLFPKADGSGSEMLPEYADGVPVSSDGGFTWTIKLKQNAQWPDGQKITADDWLFSWKAALDPVMLYANTTAVARVSNTGVDVVNAFDYWNQSTTGVEVKWEDVGFKKIDDYTIEIKLVKAVSAVELMRHFQSRYASVIRKDLYEKCMAADGKSTTYGTSVDTVMFCGPYVLTDWILASEYTLAKNETWVCADYIKLDGIYSRVVADEGTRLEMFESGQCDYMNLGTNGLAKYEEDPRTREYSANSIKCIEFNMNHSDPVKKALFNDPDFRKAIFYAIDRNAIAKLTKKIAAPFRISYLASLSTGDQYRSTPEGKSLTPANGGYDPKLANEYLDKALKKAGLTSFEVELTYAEATVAYRQASEYMQSDFQKVFGDKLTIRLQANTSLPALMRTSVKQANDSWEICWSGWTHSSETYYPCATMNCYRSDYGSRYTNYTNAALNAAYQKYISDEYILDSAKRDTLAYEMEKAFMDDMTAVPVYQDSGMTIFSDRLIPALDTYVGQLDWGCAWGDIKQ